MSLKKEKRVKKLILVMAISMPVTIAKKKLVKNIANSGSSKNGKKDKYLRTNLI